jgi:predicted Zn-dependent protease
MLQTHPLTKDRIRSADEFIREHPQRFEIDPELEERFRELKGDN